MAPKFSLVSTLAVLRWMFPISLWMVAYKKIWRTAWHKDLLSGLSLSTVVLPQAMGYGMLAGLPPVYGLYCSITPPLIYSITGRSEFVSIGTYAVMSLLMAQGLAQVCETFFATKNLDTDKELPYWQRYDPLYIPLAIYTSFLMGCFQLLFALLRGGYAAKTLLRNSFVNAFAASSGFHVVASQLKPFFSVSMVTASGAFSLPKNLYRFFVNLGSMQPLPFTLAAVSLLAMLGVPLLESRIVGKLSPSATPKTLLVPDILLAVVLMTVVSWSLSLPEYGVATAGAITRGVPPLVNPLGRVTMNLTGTLEAVPVSESMDFLTLVTLVLPLAAISFVSTYAVATVFPSKLLSQQSDHTASELAQNSMPYEEIVQDTLPKTVAAEDILRNSDTTRHRALLMLPTQLRTELAYSAASAVPDCWDESQECDRALEGHTREEFYPVTFYRGNDLQTSSALDLADLELSPKKTDLTSELLISDTKDAAWVDVDLRAKLVSAKTAPTPANMEIAKQCPSATQELFALGTCTVLSAFFSSYAPAGSLSRSAMLRNHFTTKSAFTSVFSVAISVTMLLIFPGFLEQIPLPVLSAVVVKTIWGVLAKVKIGVELWQDALATYGQSNDIEERTESAILDIQKSSGLATGKTEYSLQRTVQHFKEPVLWTATFFSVLVVSVDIGCLVGVLSSICLQFLSYFI